MTVPAPPPTVLFELAWLPEKQDYVEAFRQVGRAQRVRMLVLVVVLSAIPVAFGIQRGDAAALSIGISLPLFFLFLLGPARTRAIRDTWRRSTALHVHRQVQVSPEAGVAEWFAGSFSVNAWTRYKSVRETERVFVLVLGDIAGQPIQVLAKRGLPPGVDPRLLGDFLRERVTGSAVSPDA